jgi:hypothetical protein
MKNRYLHIDKEELANNLLIVALLIEKVDKSINDREDGFFYILCQYENVIKEFFDIYVKINVRL